MTPIERQQSLANARRACVWLHNIAFFDEELDDIQCLIAEFTRLDDKEQSQIAAGKKFGKLGAKHGKKGGRPRKAAK